MGLKVNTTKVTKHIHSFIHICLSEKVVRTQRNTMWGCSSRAETAGRNGLH